MKKLSKGKTAIVVIVLLLAVIGAATGSSSSSKKATAAAAHANCGTKATEGCTPRVGPHGTVRVDTLDWTLTDAYQTATIPNTEQSAPEGDRYVVALLKVHSGKNETVTMTPKIVKLKAGNATYEQDTTALAAWKASPSDAVSHGFDILEEIQAGETLRVAAIYRVPNAALSGHPELQFNELGLGETHAYIALPHPLRR